MASSNAARIAALQEQIDAIGGGMARKRARLPFECREIDDRIGGGLSFVSIHEIAGGSSHAIYGAAATLVRVNSGTEADVFTRAGRSRAECEVLRGWSRAQSPYGFRSPSVPRPPLRGLFPRSLVLRARRLAINVLATRDKSSERSH